MLELNIKDETSPLRSVILGIARSLGGVPKLEDAYDPKSRENIINGTYPKEEDMEKELSSFVSVFEKYDVKVYRPEVLENTNQVFARDIGFVIDDNFFISNILSNRRKEIKGLSDLIKEMDPRKVVHFPDKVRIEGGDVMPWKGKLFIGYSEAEDFEKYQVARTNRAGVDFMNDYLQNYEVFPFELNKSDTDPLENALHLDCCFQPIGTDKCIIYHGGFKNQSDVETIKEIFGEDKMIEISKQEMMEMNSNIFSISPEVIVSEKSFLRLNSVLRENGFIVEEVPFKEISKMEGLLRCTTLPLNRIGDATDN